MDCSKFHQWLTVFEFSRNGGCFPRGKNHGSHRVLSSPLRSPWKVFIEGIKRGLRGGGRQVVESVGLERVRKVTEKTVKPFYFSLTYFPVNSRTTQKVSILSFPSSPIHILVTQWHTLLTNLHPGLPVGSFGSIWSHWESLWWTGVTEGSLDHRTSLRGS